jgi:phosphate transport system protein
MLHKIFSQELQEDDLIDECYLKLYYEAIHGVLEDARNIERANYIIWTAHNLERLGDRVTNICERIIHVVTGEQPQMDTIPLHRKQSSV